MKVKDFFLIRCTFLLILLLLDLGIPLTSQNTVGVTINEPNRSEGYIFFSPFSGRSAYLIDKCGRLVNKWERGSRPGLSAYLLDSGLMLRTYKPIAEGPFTSASNAGGLELVNWNNETVWQVEINTPEWISHHDAVMMPDGNLLVLTWELVYTEELIAMGRNPQEIAPQGFMWSEKIIEIKPIYPDDYEIVWEWQIKDHYIQDFDSTKANFGIVSDHPELFDINLPDINSSNSNASRDWNHFNAIDYNASTDLILISTRNSDEIWVLDHSTTTEEAAGHNGGNLGKGGDILYRWGNASAYRKATLDDQKLFGQHGVHWIPEGLTDEGKIMIFNNGNGRSGTDYSTVEILDPPIDINGQFSLDAEGKFGPDEATVVFGQASEDRFYSPFLSNAHFISNDHILINSGSNGMTFEIDGNKDIVWSYTVPLFGDFPATQGQTVNNNGCFRVYQYAPDFEGFTDLDLTPGEPIEQNPNLINCDINNLQSELTTSKVYYNAIHNQLIFSEPIWEAEIFNLQGQSLRRLGEINTGVIQLDLQHGIYIVRFKDTNQKVHSLKILVRGN